MLTLAAAAVSQLSARVIVLLQSLLEVKNAQVVLPHGKVNAAQVVPEHTANTFTWTTGNTVRGGSRSKVIHDRCFLIE